MAATRFATTGKMHRARPPPFTAVMAKFSAVIRLLATGFEPSKLVGRQSTGPIDAGVDRFLPSAAPRGKPRSRSSLL